MNGLSHGHGLRAVNPSIADLPQGGTDQSNGHVAWKLSVTSQKHQRWNQIVPELMVEFIMTFRKFAFPQCSMLFSQVMLGMTWQ